MESWEWEKGAEWVGKWVKMGEKGLALLPKSV